MERKKSTDSLKKSNLISQKSFLEIILEQIKNCQVSFLSEKLSLNKLKQYLIMMKKNFFLISKEKINSKKYLEKEIIEKKLKIQKGLSDQKIGKHKENFQNSHYNSIDSINYTQESIFNIYKMNNKINYSNERQQLENLCFKIENELDKIEFETQRKINLIIKLRTSRLNQEENLEIFTNHKILKEKASHLMKKLLKKLQKVLLNIINGKITKDLEINNIKEQIVFLKNQLKNQKGYINLEDVIYEDSSELSNTIVIKNETKEGCSNNDEDIKNVVGKIMKNKSNRYSVDMIYKLSENYNFNNNNKDNNLNYNKINFNDINNTINKKVIRSLSNKIKKINFKNFNNNCKLNINFNFNNLNIINGQNQDDNYFSK